MYNAKQEFIMAEIKTVEEFSKYLVQLSQSQSDALIKHLKENKKIGEKGTLVIVEDFDVREVEKKEDGTKFTTIDIYLRGYDGKQYKKGMSPDFMRRYNNQLGITAEDLLGATVAITIKDKYRNAGLFAPIALAVEKGEELNLDCVESFTVEEFIDETRSNALEKLKALGL